MNSYSAVFLGVLIVAFLDIGLARCEEGQPTAEDLKSANPESRQMAVEKVQKAYRDAVSTAISVLEEEIASGKRNLRAFDMVKLLGNLRSSEASSVILRCIDWCDPKYDVPDKLVPVEEVYPAVKALGLIGIPAAKIILDALPREKEALRIRLCAVVLANVYGPECALQVLKKKEATVEASAKGPITSAIQLLTIAYPATTSNETR